MATQPSFGAIGWLVAWVFTASPAIGQSVVLFEGADIAQGHALIQQHQCEACHQNKVAGPVGSIYRPTGRINTAALLRGMVQRCDTELNLQMFPDEVDSVAAALNQKYYRFKQ